MGGSHRTRYAMTTDEELMEKFYECDNEAFDELWERRWRGRMHTYVARKVRNKDDAEDILQSAGYKLVNTKHRPSMRYDPQRGDFRSWIFRIVDNEITDYFRSKRRVELYETVVSDLSRLTAIEEEGEVPEPVEVFANNIDEIHLSIQDAVRSLSEPSRTIVWLYFWGGLTLEMVANKLGITTTQVWRRLKKDLFELKKALTQ